MTIEELRGKIEEVRRDADKAYGHETVRGRFADHVFGERMAYIVCLDLIDQYIAANKNGKKDQVADASKGILSDCCGAGITIQGGVTRHYECKSCGHACDPDHIPDTEKKVESLCGTCGGQGGYSKGMWIQPCESCINAGRLDLVVKALSQAVVNLQQRINKWDIL